MCAREKKGGSPLTEVLFYFALPYGEGYRVEGTAMPVEEERKKGPMGRRRQVRSPRAERHG